MPTADIASVHGLTVVHATVLEVVEQICAFLPGDAPLDVFARTYLVLAAEGAA